MITEPPAYPLLLRICDSLEQTALADMESAEAKRQLKGGLWAIRKIASGLDASCGLLRAEIADMEEVLAQLGEHADADCASYGSLPDSSPETPRARHVTLQARLIAVDRRAQAARAAGDPGATEALHALRALYRRMLGRESALSRQVAMKP
ncbi:hypothetical protein [Vineibacter terrae]|uniref:hypothetical protein n=1 Tax=Vineibacter terrae TaxID=2586908 RepID=UPI002E306FC3|nr:hypothetical protein [Vineibacter terrae]HEX2884948.1 hypothetical protein [Vineibacter terrae]